MMHVEIITVPFDSGMRETRMGRGPGHLLHLGIVERLRALGAEAHVSEIAPSSDVFPSEVRMAFEIQRQLASVVADAHRRGSFSLVLSGNCNTAVGTVAGLRSASGKTPAVCWFDAHADFNTPETTIGGFLDGMAVSMLTGHCWRTLTAQVPGFVPVPDAHVLLIGTRDVDPLEQQLIDKSEVKSAQLASDVGAELDAIIATADSSAVYLHLDLDAIDVAEGRANSYAVAGGLSRRALLDSIDAIAARARIQGAAITAYDPSGDIGDRIGHLAIEAAISIITAAGAGAS
jgi:arginase